MIAAVCAEVCEYTVNMGVCILSAVLLLSSMQRAHPQMRV